MKRVLDACCGSRMFYFDKADPEVLFADNRELETTLCDGRTGPMPSIGEIAP